jgi:hypothetical protein
VFARVKHSSLSCQSVNNCEEKWNDTFLRNSCFKIFSFWVRVNQHTHFPLSTMYFPLLPVAVRPNDYVSSMGVTLACYQQAGSGGKYVGVSGKWIRWFTPTLSFSVFVGSKRQFWGATTFRITTFSIMTFRIAIKKMRHSPSIMTLETVVLSVVYA